MITSLSGIFFIYWLLLTALKCLLLLPFAKNSQLFPLFTSRFLKFQILWSPFPYTWGLHFLTPPLFLQPHSIRFFPPFLHRNIFATRENGYFSVLLSFTFLEASSTVAQSSVLEMLFYWILWNCSFHFLRRILPGPTDYVRSPVICFWKRI